MASWVQTLWSMTWCTGRLCMPLDAFTSQLVSWSCVLTCWTNFFVFPALLLKYIPDLSRLLWLCRCVFGQTHVCVRDWYVLYVFPCRWKCWCRVRMESSVLLWWPIWRVLWQPPSSCCQRASQKKTSFCRSLVFLMLVSRHKKKGKYCFSPTNTVFLKCRQIC